MCAVQKDLHFLCFLDLSSFYYITKGFVLVMQSSNLEIEKGVCSESEESDDDYDNEEEH